MTGKYLEESDTDTHNQVAGPLRRPISTADAGWRLVSWRWGDTRLATLRRKGISSMQLPDNAVSFSLSSTYKTPVVAHAVIGLLTTKEDGKWCFQELS